MHSLIHYIYFVWKNKSMCQIEKRQYFFNKYSIVHVNVNAILCIKIILICMTWMLCSSKQFKVSMSISSCVFHEDINKQV